MLSDFKDVVTWMYAIYTAPVQISLALGLLYQFLGPSIFAGFGMMVLLDPPQCDSIREGEEISGEREEGRGGEGRGGEGRGGEGRGGEGRGGVGWGGGGEGWGGVGWGGVGWGGWWVGGWWVGGWECWDSGEVELQACM